MFENTLFDHFVHVLLVEKERKEGGKEERKEERKNCERGRRKGSIGLCSTHTRDIVQHLLRLSAIFARTTVLFDDSKSGAAVFGDFVTVREKTMGEKNNRTGELKR